MRSTREPTTLRREAGVSLIETMVSLSLFAITIAAVGTFLTTHIRRSAWTFQRTYAYALAEQEIEAMRALDYEHMASRSATATLGGTTYKVATTVKNNSPVPQVKTVTVTVSWSDPRGPQQVTVSTIYAQVRR